MILERPRQGCDHQVVEEDGLRAERGFVVEVEMDIYVAIEMWQY